MALIRAVALAGMLYAIYRSVGEGKHGKELSGRA
jgi:hypothetical protein